MRADRLLLLSPATWGKIAKGPPPHAEAATALKHFLHMEQAQHYAAAASGPVSMGTPTRLPHSVHEPS